MSFLLETTKFNPASLPLEETLYHCANGYLGVRGNFEEGKPEGYPGIHGTYINAFHDTHPIHHPEKLFGFPETGERILNITDVQALIVEVEGERLLPKAERICNYKRTLDMKSGIVTRTYLWTGEKGGRVQVQAQRVASLPHPEYFIMTFSLTALDAVELNLKSLIKGRVENFSNPDDPRVSPEGFKSLSVKNVAVKGKRISMESRTAGTDSALWVQADHRMHKGSALIDPVNSESEETSASLSWQLRLAAGESLTLEKRVRFTDSLRYAEEPLLSAPEDIPWFEEFAALQKNYLDVFWKDADITIEGDNHVLAGLRFSLYQMCQSGSRDSKSGIPAKGLSGEGYEGHYFWDTEIYMLPFFLYTRPETARRLLEYRHSTLPAARKHARELGHRRGAAYPWRTITGRECSAYYPSGSAQYHINADIAFAVGRYWDATGDNAFMLECGGEILFETARVWMEVGNFTAGAFHINGVTGPDEYTCMVNDNYYTNCMVRENLIRAASVFSWMAENNSTRLAELTDQLALNSEEKKSWERAAEQMLIPYDSERDINPQDDSFLNKAPWNFQTDGDDREPLLLRYHHMTLSRFQICKQADTVLAHVLLEGEEKPSTLRNSFEFYEKVTTHDSSLSYAAFSIMAARLGETEKALNYLQENASLDLDDSHGNTRDGIHAANMGGAWMSLVMGFGGFSPAGRIPAFRPGLPPSWKSLGYRIRWRQSIIAVEVSSGILKLTLEDGPPLDVEIFGKRILLETVLTGAVPD